MDEESGGTIAPVINNYIDFSTINNYLEGISSALNPTNKTIIRNCAISLFVNTNFEYTKKSSVQIAKECVERALIMAKELKNQNLLAD